MNFTPTKRGTEKVLAMLKVGGGHNSFEVVLTQELDVLAILMGSTTSLSSLKVGGV